MIYVQLTKTKEGDYHFYSPSLEHARDNESFSKGLIILFFIWDVVRHVDTMSKKRDDDCFQIDYSNSYHKDDLLLNDEEKKICEKEINDHFNPYRWLKLLKIGTRV